MTDDPAELPELQSARLTLEPIGAAHAAGLAVALQAEDNYRFIGGEPESEEGWRDRLLVWERRQSPDGDEQWLNWAVRLTATQELIGYVQATVISGVADIAYVIGAPWQRHGYAREATADMVGYLRAGLRVTGLRAWIADRHEASRRVAEVTGLLPTAVVDAEGERMWSDVSSNKQR